MFDEIRDQGALSHSAINRGCVEAHRAVNSWMSLRGT